MRASFSRRKNLKETYNVCSKILGNIDIEEFLDAVRIMDRNRIWAYTNLSVQIVPYTMVVMKPWLIDENEERELNLHGVFRRYVNKQGQKDYQIVFHDLSGNQHNDLRPIGVPDELIEEGRADTDWISEATYRKLKKGISKT